ncbi:AP2 domain transcription factor, putative [Hepatocystis sp. ex Piliocolobus tephrosceles]|nr:AP2 domain transcription factor, putative [Hepatocystis sp. ex Piliocolobus tephrosceles]
MTFTCFFSHSKISKHNYLKTKLYHKPFLQNGLINFNKKCFHNMLNCAIKKNNSTEGVNKNTYILQTNFFSPIKGGIIEVKRNFFFYGNSSSICSNTSSSINNHVYQYAEPHSIGKNSLNYHKKFFSGRSGGLKRKKKKKGERKINTCSGKRLEFFYPKKKRRQRIGLIQNSRKNIVYDNVLKRFLVYYYKQGIQVFRSFSCKKKRKFESSRNKAIILSRQYQQKYFKHNNDNKTKNDFLNINDNTNLGAKYTYDIKKNMIKIIPDKNKSGYRGVFYDTNEHAYICVYNEAGIRKYQIFKIQNNDYLEAYNLAVMCRRYKLFKNYQFVSQRNRIRSGRIHLK